MFSPPPSNLYPCKFKNLWPNHRCRLSPTATDKQTQTIVCWCPWKQNTTPLNQKRRETQDVWNEGGKQEDTGREVLEPWMEKEEGRKEWRKEWRKRRRERFEVEREFGREIKGRTEQRRKNKLNLQRSPWGIRWGWSSGGLKMAPQPGLYLSSNCACDWE